MFKSIALAAIAALYATVSFANGTAPAAAEATKAPVATEQKAEEKKVEEKKEEKTEEKKTEEKK